MSFLKTALKTLKNEYASIVEDGLSTDNTGFIDTGSYIINAQIGGSIYSGFPSNKMSILVGPSGTGKSFFALSTVKSFQEKHPDGEVAYFDSEAAFTQEMFQTRGMDTSRIAMIPVSSLDEFKFQCLKVLEQYEAIDKKERPPLMLVLDSLGNLATVKELTDASEGKSVMDMSRGRAIRSIFRVLTLKMGKLNVPMICTNHSYATMDIYNPVAMGGDGARYNCSVLLFLSKKKERDGDRNVIGNIVHVHADKSRLTKEQTKIDTRIFFESGLDRYYGLVDLAVECGIWKKISTRIELETGTKVYQTVIERDPEKYFNKTVLDAIDKYCPKKFCYGKDDTIPEDDELNDDPDAIDDSNTETEE